MVRRSCYRWSQKKLGFRYLMDVIPLDATLVRGSHGLSTVGDAGPLVMGEVPGPPGLVPVGIGGTDDEASDAVGGGNGASGLEHGPYAN